MKKLSVLIIILLLNISLGFGQDESMYDLKVSDKKKVITKPDYSLVVYEVIENNYQNQATSSGPKLLEIEGYRLSEGLKVLGNFMHQSIRIGNLKSNPYIKWRFDLLKPGRLSDLNEDIFSELANYYGFKLSKESAISKKYDLDVSDRSKLASHKVKNVKKGVLSESNKKKSGAWTVSHTTLQGLVSWLEKTYFIRFTDKNFEDLGIYDFDFKSADLEGVIEQLRRQYGLEITSENVQEKVYFIQ